MGSFLLQVQIPGLENLQVFVPGNLATEKSTILQFLNAAAGKDCSKESDDALIDAHLLLTKHSDRTLGPEDSWATWEAQPVKIVPQVETVDTLRSMQVCHSQSHVHASHPYLEAGLLSENIFRENKLLAAPEWLV